MQQCRDSEGNSPQLFPQHIHESTNGVSETLLSNVSREVKGYLPPHCNYCSMLVLYLPPSARVPSKDLYCI